MPSLLFNKYFIGLVGIIALVGSLYSLYYFKCAKPIVDRDKMLTVYGIKINNLEVDLDKCKADSAVTDFESFFEGGGNVETGNTGDNIFLKRVH